MSSIRRVSLFSGRPSVKELKIISGIFFLKRISPSTPTSLPYFSKFYSSLTGQGVNLPKSQLISNHILLCWRSSVERASAFFQKMTGKLLEREKDFLASIFFKGSPPEEVTNSAKDLLKKLFQWRTFPLLLLSPFPSKFLKNSAAAQNLTRC